MTESRSEKVMSGRIPWSTDEFFAILQHRNQLHEVPHDDWDRRRRGFRMKDDDGGEFEMVFNVDMPDVQMGLFMADRYQDLPREKAMSHINRWYMIVAFVSDHLQDLLERGLIRESNDPEMAEMAGALVDVLVREPYTRTNLEEEEPCWEYDYEIVIQKALERLEQED